ncbi:hypothetical protein GGR22_000252 [Flavobacterium gossypii]|uniref:Lipoprotein n=2 Tax=Flavobacterium TaxID=237 RepID=A0A495MGS8_9FLAO|nr:MULTISPECIES: hypothetical protein [Flavobacterium]MBA9072126.1 hypothetical protein [Flavobacterium gossypii]RKS25174.1 hypothetical protein CLV94_0204 [Flavobacterium endophyticum]
MKKIFLLALVVISAYSCKDLSNGSDMTIQKDSLGTVVGNDKDDKGCVASAGYTWSELKKNCIRPFEVGIRLNPATEIKQGDAVYSAFAVLEENGDRAELFIPNEKLPLMLVRESEGKPYVKDDWKLQTTKGYKLMKGDSLLYAGALINEEVITGSDRIDD